MRKLLITVIGFLITNSIFSQQFGGTPPSQKWKQINTDTVRVIYPVGLDSQAQHIASIVHHLAATKPVKLGEQLKKIPIILQHQTIIPNAYVGLGPFRSEFYLTPATNSFDQGSVPWVDQLALHEYRHVHQFNSFNNGLSKLMGTLFGEDGYALAINAAVPDWFFEGDAVYQETVLTDQGRGRVPFFLNAYPSLWQAGKKYSWMKLRNGSLKDYVPNHYYLGFLMVNYGYAKYGPDFWAKVTRDASAYKSLLYPFQAAIKKYSGVSYQEFRKQAFDFYKEKTKEIISTPAPSYVFPVKKSYVVNYVFPYQAGTDTLVYLKNTYRHRPAFFMRSSRGEKKIKLRDISIDDQFSYRNGKIVYSAYETDARWGWRDYSVIRILDTRTKKQTKLTTRTKYFTPDISDDGSKVAAVQNDSSGKSELHIIDATNGKLIRSIHAADILVFSDPKFIDDSSLVTAVRLKDGKMALAIAETGTGNTMRLTPPSFNVVGYPSVDNGIIYFTASHNGRDDVFALRRSEGKIYQLTEGPVGNYFVNAGHGKITWSSFTAEGYQLRQIDEKDAKWSEVSNASFETLSNKIETAAGNDLNKSWSSTPWRTFPTKDYKKSTKLLNFHSWRPNYDDPVFSFSVYGQNVLNTLQTELYYLYHRDEKTSAVGFNSVFAGWYPYVAVGSEFTFHRQANLGSRIHTWDQLDSRVGVILPISKTSGKTYKDFLLGTYYVLRNEFNKGFFKDSAGNTHFSYIQHFLNWTTQVQRAKQHIYPRWAFTLSSSYRYAISHYKGYQFIGTGVIFVPGILSTHNLILSGSFQQRDTNYLLFSTRFSTARGYVDYYGTTAGSRLTRLSADYHLPLLYPDWGFGNIVFLSRLRANVFYDYQKIFSNNKKLSAHFRTVGGELYIDTRWWNEYPLTFGLRMSHLLDDDPFGGNKKGANIFEFLLPVSIIPR